MCQANVASWTDEAATRSHSQLVGKGLAWSKDPCVFFGQDRTHAETFSFQLLMSRFSP